MKDYSEESKIEDIVEHIPRMIKKIEEDGHLMVKISNVRNSFNISRDMDNNIIKKRLNNILNEKGIKVYISRDEYIFEKTAKHSTKIRHKFLGKETPEEIPLTTEIDICIKRLRKYHLEHGTDEKLDHYHDNICSVNYGDMSYYMVQSFVFEKTIVVHPGESLYFLLKEDQKYPINGIVNKECTQFKIKTKIIYEKGTSKGKPTYYIFSEKPNKGSDKTEEPVKLYDVDRSKRDIDKAYDNRIIKVDNKFSIDLMIKGKDEIVKGDKPYEFWIYLEKTCSTKYRDKLKSKKFKGRPSLVPPEECKVIPNKIERLKTMNTKGEADENRY